MHSRNGLVSINTTTVTFIITFTMSSLSNSTTFATNGFPDDDSQLPEGVDFSEGGWATDYAAALVGFLFFVTAITSRQSLFKRHQFFQYMFLGTGIAHLFGGFAHRYYSNRAAEGVGQVGFYATMMVGYSGNIVRYTLGWGLPGNWLCVVGVINWLFLISTGVACIVVMERTQEELDDADNDGTWYLPDLLFVLAEALAAIMEVLTCLLYLCKNLRKESWYYVLFACVVNIVGWISVYAGFMVSVSKQKKMQSCLDPPNHVHQRA